MTTPHSLSDAESAVPEPDPWSTPAETPITKPFPDESAKKTDPMRPEAVRGRYMLPHPITGKPTSWQRVSNLIKLAEDTHHLEKWKRRNVAKGLAMRPDYVEAMQFLEVKRDKEKINRIVERSQEVAGAHKMSDEGTDLHTSTELADYAGGSLEPVKDDHKSRVRLYLDALKANGLRVPEGMIERVIVSTRYEVAGKFDRIYQLGDGSYVIGDLKTGDSLELSMHAISAQLACYEDGINSYGVWDGRRYDETIAVRTDFGIVVHLPSTREEVTVYKIDLATGRRLNEVCMQVRVSRRKSSYKGVAQVFDADAHRAVGTSSEADWLELLNAAHTVSELIDIAARARVFGQWTERLAEQARLMAAELTIGKQVTGS